MDERVAYDEFGLFHENAAEYGLRYDGPPAVRREEVEVAPGRRLSALVWGDGPPELVLLHGGSQNAHTWDTVAMALRPRPLVAIDLPGHGHSDRPGVEQLESRSPLAAAADVAVAVRALAPAARGVVGMSYGGLTAVGLTAVAPELVRRLVLVDVLPGLKAEHAQHIVDFVNGPATFPSFDELLARTIQFNPTRSVSSLRRGILHNALQLDDGSWVWRHSRWRVETPPSEATAPPATPATQTTQDPATDTAAASPGQGDDDVAERIRVGEDGRVESDLADVLARIEVPVLLARGLRPDSVLRDDDEAHLRELLPAAEVVHFAEAGHSIQGDMPVELAATIARFVP